MSDIAAASTTRSDPPLIIDDLVGQRRKIDPGEVVTVGRAATFRVGADDHFLHRVLFELWHSGQGWTIRNVGSHMMMEIAPRRGRSFSVLTLGPGSVLPVPAGPTAVTFTTPERFYELHIDIPSTGLIIPEPTPLIPGARETRTRHIPTASERKIMDLLAEPLLKYPGVSEEEIPSVVMIAQELGMTEKAVNTRIERLCEHLRKDGFPMPRPLRVSLARYAVSRKRG